MDRNKSLETIEKIDKWDVIVIGGGATGLGVAVDAASRGYKTLLLEQSDFAKGTSSRSTKLVHGGVRYLEQGNLQLVREALRERGYILKNAPHLAKKQAFIIPVYSLWERIKYSAGLKLYDLMAGSQRVGHSSWLRKTKVIESMSGVKEDKLKGGVLYYDGQFDDARMAVSLAATCTDLGGTVVNYMRVTALAKDGNGRLDRVEATDLENERTYHLQTRAVVNATGVFVDDIHKLDTGTEEHTVQPSQGVHLVLPPHFLQTTQCALMIPATDDGRVLFVVPWHNHLLAGTTDTPLEEHTLEPRALKKEVDFILRNAGKYLKDAPERKDVLSIYAGLRPLALPEGGETKGGKATKDISRTHSLQVSESGLVTITGGKWTTYRRMAEDTVDKTIMVAGLPAHPCATKALKIHGWRNDVDPGTGREAWENIYGSDAVKIQALVRETPALGKPLDANWSFTCAEVVWAVRREMARTVEDVLSRRFRVLFLDARAAMKMAPDVARIMKEELGKDEDWARQQVNAFQALASEYLLVAPDDVVTGADQP